MDVYTIRVTCVKCPILGPLATLLPPKPVRAESVKKRKDAL
jgi:hypothetical protein